MSAESYVRFEETDPAPKTRRWTVWGRDNGALLGWVKWFGRWRCYTFWPAQDTTFNAGCLQDVAAFCLNETARHKYRALLHPTEGEG